MHNSTMRSTKDINEVLKKCTLTDDEADPAAEEDRLQGRLSRRHRESVKVL